METELKLRFVHPDGQTRFLSSAWLQQLVMPDSTTKTEMLSRYYDTQNHDLTRLETSLRIRQEGDLQVVTIKLGGQSSNGLHQRLEWSVELDDDNWKTDLESGLDTDWFQKHAISDGDPDERLHEVLQVIEGQPLQEICQAGFTRTAFDVGFGDTLMELALDDGELHAGDLSDVINELELELKEGDVRDLMELGSLLMDRYELVPEIKSKYARCLDLLKRQEKDGDG